MRRAVTVLSGTNLPVVFPVPGTCIAHWTQTKSRVFPEILRKSGRPNPPFRQAKPCRCGAYGPLPAYAGRGKSWLLRFPSPVLGGGGLSPPLFLGIARRRPEPFIAGPTLAAGAGGQAVFTLEGAMPFFACFERGP